MLFPLRSLVKPAIATLLLWQGLAIAGEDLKVSNAWVRATAPGQQVAAAYMELQSPVDAALVSAQSPVARSVEIHLMKMEGSVMKMRQMEKLHLPARKTVKLDPGGYHFMLTDLKRQLKKGETVPLVLTVERKNRSKATIEVKAQVREAGGGEHPR